MDPWAHIAWCLILLPADSSLADCHRFPPREYARQCMVFNRSYRCHVELQLIWYAGDTRRWWYWQEALWETDRLYHVWDALHAAQGGEWPDEIFRLKWLRNMREMIGEEAYAAGRMPPPVPIWRFSYGR